MIVSTTRSRRGRNQLIFELMECWWFIEILVPFFIFEDETLIFYMPSYGINSVRIVFFILITLTVKGLSSVLSVSWMQVRRMTISPHWAGKYCLHLLRLLGKSDRKELTCVRLVMLKRWGLIILLSDDIPEKVAGRSYETPNSKESVLKSTKQSGVSDLTRGSLSGERRNSDATRSCRINSTQNNHLPLHNPSVYGIQRLPLKESSAASVTGRSRREQFGSTSEIEKLPPNKDKMLTASMVEKNPKSVDHLKKQISLSERTRRREMEHGNPWMLGRRKGTGRTYLHLHFVFLLVFHILRG